METIGGLVSQVSSLAMYGVSLDEINQYVGRVQAIKANDVKAFASTQLNAGSASLIVVGDAKKFLPALQKDFPQVERAVYAWNNGPVFFQNGEATSTKDYLYVTDDFVVGLK